MLEQNTLIGFIVLLIAIPVVVNLLSSEISDWLPRWSERLVQHAAKRLPEHVQAQYENDWLAELEIIPGKLSKLAFALGLFPGLASLSRAQQTNAVLSQTQPLIKPEQTLTVKDASRPHFSASFVAKVLLLAISLLISRWISSGTP
jgi:hypothetical protein